MSALPKVEGSLRIYLLPAEASKPKGARIYEASVVQTRQLRQRDEKFLNTWLETVHFPIVKVPTKTIFMGNERLDLRKVVGNQEIKSIEFGYFSQECVPPSSDELPCFKVNLDRVSSKDSPSTYLNFQGRTTGSGRLLLSIIDVHNQRLIYDIPLKVEEVSTQALFDQSRISFTFSSHSVLSLIAGKNVTHRTLFSPHIIKD